MKFDVGEIAIFISTSKCGRCTPGQEVEVVEVGPWQIGDVVRNRNVNIGGDYVVRWHKMVMMLYEYDLRKRRPPIPDEVLTIFTSVKRDEPA